MQYACSLHRFLLTARKNKDALWTWSQSSVRQCLIEERGTAKQARRPNRHPSLQNGLVCGRLGRTGSDFGGAAGVGGDLTPALAKNVSADLNFSVASLNASRS